MFPSCGLIFSGSFQINPKWSQSLEDVLQWQNHVSFYTLPLQSQARAHTVHGNICYICISDSCISVTNLICCISLTTNWNHLIVVHAKDICIRKVEINHCNIVLIVTQYCGGEAFIGMHVLFMLYPPVPGTDAGSSYLPAVEGPFPSHKLQRSMTLPYIGDDIVDSELHACQSF